ncbi:small kinetochore-associated protein [Ambystoma mexicanum]|uniref:small kinetochore-associated protein n=1 Tax=Ambystoma mexicanum TaxID=8296 RepID=UPI0037E82E99
MECAEMDRSKIPVYGSQLHNAPGKQHLADTHVRSEKIVLPAFTKERNVTFSAKIQEGALFKGTDRSKFSLPATKRTTGVKRGPVNRNKVEADLSERNQLLEAANQHLRIDLEGTRETVKGLQEKQAALESEVAELNKHLERNMVILENRNIDPVTGNRILESLKESDRCRAETKLLTESLMEELNSFCNAASEQRDTIQAIKSMCRDAEEERKHFLEKQKAFQQDTENFRQSLKQVELLLEQ